MPHATAADWTPLVEFHSRSIFDGGRDGGLRANDSLPEGANLRRAYYACVSHVDEGGEAEAQGVNTAAGQKAGAAVLAYIECVHKRMATTPTTAWSQNRWQDWVLLLHWLYSLISLVFPFSFLLLFLVCFAFTSGRCPCSSFKEPDPYPLPSHCPTILNKIVKVSKRRLG